MKRLRLLLLLVTLLGLGTPAVAQETKEAPKPAPAVVQEEGKAPGQAVYVMNIPVVILYALVALSGVNAALLAVVWSQLSGIRTAVEKSAARAEPKT